MNLWLLVPIVLLVAPGAVAPQVGWVPMDVLQRPIGIRTGIGHAHEVVTTQSPEAQRFYDQGLSLLHSYFWIDAARSFHQALRLDPSLAMAHVGLSYTYSGFEDDDAARGELEQAQALMASASEREKQRVEIRARQLEAMAEPGNAPKLQAYRAAVDVALAKWPDDPQLWLLAGNAAEPSPWGRGQRGPATTIALYEAVLARSPDDFAAHHYLTHTYETIGNAERALQHGEAYARLAPAIPHAQHMYAHDLRRVGRVADALHHFEHTRELEEAYFASQQIPPEFDWHYAHNLSLLATGYQHEGRLAEASDVLIRLYKLPKFLPRFDFTRREWVEFLLGRGRADEALAAARDMQQAPSAGVRSLGHVLAGHALLASNRIQEAAAELAESEREAGAIVARGPLPLTAGMLKSYRDALVGEILLRSGRAEEGSRYLRDVQQLIRAELGADAWISAVFRLEGIARVAREVGEWDLAEYTARQMIDHDTAYAGGHYALALVAKHRNDAETARRGFQEAIRLWSHADADLPELKAAREHLATTETARSR